MNVSRRENFSPSASFFDDFLTKNLSGWFDGSNEGGSVPKVNIIETNDDFQVEMAAPGMKKEDFHVELDNDMLTIYAEISENAEENHRKYTRREFRYHSFRRSFHLPNTVESDKIKASYKNGILHLLIPKKEEARKKPAKTIAIS